MVIRIDPKILANKLVVYLQQLPETEKKSALRILGNGGISAMSWVVIRSKTIFETPEMISINDIEEAIISARDDRSFEADYKVIWLNL